MNMPNTLKVQNIEPGMHPSEKLVTIHTSHGNEQLFVDSDVLVNDMLPVSHPLQSKNGHRLVELPRETIRGAWRVWADKDDLVSAP